jgi:hypothetical protein
MTSQKKRKNQLHPASHLAGQHLQQQGLRPLPLLLLLEPVPPLLLLPQLHSQHLQPGDQAWGSSSRRENSSNSSSIRAASSTAASRAA